MGAQRVEAVADAGPLIHLHEIGQIRLLNLFVAVMFRLSFGGRRRRADGFRRKRFLACR
jgi:hypothetical protein